MTPFKWTNKLAFLLLAATLLFSCKQSATMTQAEQKAVTTEVTDMLNSYNQEVKQSGLMAELKYLDSSEYFFWVPPGYSGSLSYDSVVAILKQNATQNKIIDNTFDTLTIIPLSKDIAVYTGLLRSIMTDTLGKKETYRLAETGTVIKRDGHWKLLSGQTSLLNNHTTTEIQPSSNESGLGFLVGKWDFKIWFNDNNSDKPDISATWTLEKSLDNVECYTGKVEMNGIVFTSEIIAFNSYTNEYERTVMTNSGAYVTLKTQGWKGNKLIWTGSQNLSKQKTELKEELTKLTDNEFEAKFYQLQNNEWQLIQTEHLVRTH